MLNLTKPRYVMPFHGDHKRLRLHAELAESVGHRSRRGSSGRATACRSRSTSRRRPPRRGRRRRHDLRRRRRHRRPRRRRAARPAGALGRRRLHRRRDDLVRGRRPRSRRPRSSSAASRSSDEDRRRSSRSSATSSRRRSPTRRAHEERETAPAPGGPARRHRRASSTSACGAGRWCCRWSSRFELASFAQDRVPGGSLASRPVLTVAAGGGARRSGPPARIAGAAGRRGAGGRVAVGEPDDAPGRCNRLPLPPARRWPAGARVGGGREPRGGCAAEARRRLHQALDQSSGAAEHQPRARDRHRLGASRSVPAPGAGLGRARDRAGKRGNARLARPRPGRPAPRRLRRPGRRRQRAGAQPAQPAGEPPDGPRQALQPESRRRAPWRQGAAQGPPRPRHAPAAKAPPQGLRCRTSTTARTACEGAGSTRCAARSARRRASPASAGPRSPAPTAASRR